jgi:hypothetical protein
MENGRILEPGNPKRIAAEREVVRLAWQFVHAMAALHARGQEPQSHDEVDEWRIDFDLLQTGFCREVKSVLERAVE